MLTEGLYLMVTGMSVVFAFLSLLVLAMNISAGFFNSFSSIFGDDVVPSSPTSKKTTGTILQPSDELAEVAVAIAAVKACTG